MMKRVIHVVVSRPDQNEEKRLQSKYPEGMLERYVNATWHMARAKSRSVSGINWIMSSQPSWWGKLELFAPYWDEDEVIYFIDLDHAIIGDLGKLFDWADDHPADVVSVREPHAKYLWTCTSVMRIRTRTPGARKVWDLACKYGFRPDTGYGVPKAGWNVPNDTHVICEAIGDEIAHFPLGWVVPYNVVGGDQSQVIDPAIKLTDETVCVHFHGPNNKPHMVAERGHPAYLGEFLSKHYPLHLLTKGAS